MRKDSWFRSALLSVLFFTLIIGNAPAMAQDGNDDPLDWGLDEVQPSPIQR